MTNLFVCAIINIAKTNNLKGGESLKRLEKSEKEACYLSLAWVVCYGIGCYAHSMAVILISSLFVAVLLACSWRIERLERRIDYYRKELDKQIRRESEEEEPKITITKGKSA